MLDRVLNSESKYLTKFVAAEHRLVEQNEMFQTFITSAGHRLEMAQIKLRSGSEWSTKGLGKGLFFLPAIGSLALSDSSGNQYVVAPEELMFCPSIQESVFKCSNDYDSDINFYVFHFSSDADIPDQPIKTSFKLNSKNRLFGAGLLDHWKMGVFDSRIKSTLLLNKAAPLFVTCLHGCFEFEERMLNQGDSVYFNELQSAAFESLTEFAILLTIELNKKQQ